MSTYFEIQQKRKQGNLPYDQKSTTIRTMSVTKAQKSQDIKRHNNRNHQQESMNKKQFITYTSLFDKLNDLNHGKPGENQQLSQTQKPLTLSDLRSEKSIQFTKNNPSFNMPTQSNMCSENKENYNPQFQSQKLQASYFSHNHNKLSTERLYRPSFSSMASGYSSLSPSKKTQPIIPVHQQSSFCSPRPNTSSTNPNQTETMFSSVTSLNSLNQNPLVNHNPNFTQPTNTSYYQAQNITTNPPCAHPLMGSMTSLNSQNPNPFVNTQETSSSINNNSPIVSNLQTSSRREKKKNTQMVEIHSQFNNYVAKINEKKLLEQQQIYKKEQERQNALQKEQMVSSMIQSHRQFLNKNEIQNLFNIDDMERLESSLTPVKDKLFTESANASSSVNRYFSIKHNQTLDRINYLRNLKLSEETKECTHKPQINKKSAKIASRGRSTSKTLNDQTHQVKSLLNVLEKDNEQVMENLKHRVNSQKGITFSPSINQSSKELKRGVQKLIIWNEVKKIKQNEKQKVYEEHEYLQKQQHYMLPQSKEILKMKSIREVEKLQEERFDYDEFEDVFRFSPSRVISSPGQNLSQNLSQKPLVIQRGVNSSLIKLGQSVSSSQLDNYSRSTTSTLISPKNLQQQKQLYKTKNQQISQLSDANTSVSKMQNTTLMDGNPQSQVKDSTQTDYYSTYNLYYKSQQNTTAQNSQLNYQQQLYQQHQNQLHKQQLNFNNQINLNDYSNQKQLNNQQHQFYQPAQQNRNFKYLEQYPPSSQKKTFDSGDYEYSRSQQMDLDQDIQERQQQQNQVKQKLQQLYEQEEEDNDQDQEYGYENNNADDNEDEQLDMEKMQQAKEIRERLNQFYLEKQKNNSSQNSMQYEEVSDLVNDKTGNSVNPSQDRSTSDFKNNISNNNITSGYGDISSRTTGFDATQIENQSYLGGNIMVKGMYKYDQVNNPSPQQLNIQIANNSKLPPLKPQGQVKESNMGYNSHSNSNTMIINQSQGMITDDASNSTFTQNINNISAIGLPPQQTQLLLQQNSSFGTNDGLKLSFNYSQSNPGTNSNTIQLPTTVTDSQMVINTQKAQSFTNNQLSNQGLDQESHNQNIATSLAIISNHCQSQTINQQNRQIPQAHLQPQLQIPPPIPNQQMQFFVPQPSPQNTKPLISSHQSNTAKIKPNQHQQALAAAHFFSMMMQQTMQQQQLKNNESNSKNQSSQMQQVSQASISSPQNFPSQIFNFLANNQNQQHQQQQQQLQQNSNDSNSSNTLRQMSRLQTPQFCSVSSQQNSHMRLPQSQMSDPQHTSIMMNQVQQQNYQQMKGNTQVYQSNSTNCFEKLNELSLGDHEDEVDAITQMHNHHEQEEAQSEEMLLEKSSSQQSNSQYYDQSRHSLPSNNVKNNQRISTSSYSQKEDRLKLQYI